MNPSATGHSRQNPIPRYVELLDLYRRMHAEGEPAHHPQVRYRFVLETRYRNLLGIKKRKKVPVVG